MAEKHGVYAVLAEGDRTRRRGDTCSVVMGTRVAANKAINHRLLVDIGQS